MSPPRHYGSFIEKRARAEYLLWMQGLRKQINALRVMLFALAIGVIVLPNIAASEVGSDAPAIADCVSASNARILGVDVKWLKDESVQILPNSTSRFTFLAGKLGWHTTWMALLDMDARPVVAFETNSKNLRTGPSGFARRNVPLMIKWALKTCDVTWIGTPTQQLVDELLSDF